MQRTKIVCTIGPACSEPAILVALLRMGMDVARINFSHGDIDSHTSVIKALRDASEKTEQPLAILADLQGPKLRVGRMQEGGVELVDGEEITLTTRSVIGQPGVVPIQYESLPQLLEPGVLIYLDDGLIELEVMQSKDEEIVCRVLTGGLLESNKGINLPRAPLGIPAITDKDREDLQFALEHGVDWIGLSFVRRADEITELKRLIGEADVPVIAKIEKPEAMEHIEEIIEVSDGIMVARGDLGVETSPEAVPLMQKHIIRLCNLAGKPVITATQMLDSMMRNPRPTRAEASDVANAVLDGTDAVMLSGETAVGKYPLRAVQTMGRIVEEVELSESWRQVIPLHREGEVTGVACAVCRASAQTAEEIRSSAIIAPTLSGYTARTLSTFRTSAPIVAITTDRKIQRQLMLFWGVYPLHAPRREGTDEIIESAIATAQRAGFVKSGETVVITAGAAGSAPGTTNLMRVYEV